MIFIRKLLPLALTILLARHTSGRLLGKEKDGEEVGKEHDYEAREEGPGIAASNGTPMKPTGTGNAEFFGLSKSVPELPTIDAASIDEEDAELGYYVPDPDFVETILPAAGDPDAALDEGPTTNSMPATIRNFDGMTSSGFSPPDTVGDVGPNHYVQMVNIDFQILTKTGTPLTKKMPINAIFEGVPECESGHGDPIVLYDQFEDRWLLTQFTAACLRGNNFPICYNCLAISETGDPTGRYYRYRFPAQTENSGSFSSVFPDYPKWSVWSDTYVLTTRDFGEEPFYAGMSLYFLQKAPLLTGSTVPVAQFVLPESVFNFALGDGYHMLAADVDGNDPPLPGSPIPIVSSHDDDFGGPSDRIYIWQAIPNWSVPTVLLFNPIELPVAEFSSNVCGLFCRQEVSQPGTDQRVDSFGYSLLH